MQSDSYKPSLLERRLKKAHKVTVLIAKFLARTDRETDALTVSELFQLQCLKHAALSVSDQAESTARRCRLK